MSTTSAIKRYSNTPVIGLNRYYGTSYAIPAIRENMQNGNIRYREIVIKEAIRLDTLAGIEYGDGTLWWIIAAASNVGYGLGILPGTIIRIPDMSDVSKYV